MRLYIYIYLLKCFEIYLREYILYTNAFWPIFINYNNTHTTFEKIYLKNERIMIVINLVLKQGFSTYT